MKNKLILVCGCPASGKSTWATTYLRNNPDTVCLSSDTLRARFGKSEEDQSVTKIVFDYIYTELEMKLQTNTVLIDATNINKKDRSGYLNIATKYGVPVEIYVFERTKDVLFNQNKKRADTGGRNVPDWVIEKMFNKYERPSMSEGFSNIIFVP